MKLMRKLVFAALTLCVMGCSSSPNLPEGGKRLFGPQPLGLKPRTKRTMQTPPPEHLPKTNG